jgi:hypothetical protein
MCQRKFGPNLISETIDEVDLFADPVLQAADLDHQNIDNSPKLYHHTGIT